MSPVGRPDATELLWCAACGIAGSEFAQRMALKGEPKPPTPRVRICPSCAKAGWKLHGEGIDAGHYFRPGSGRPSGRFALTGTGAAMPPARLTFGGAA